MEEQATGQISGSSLLARVIPLIVAALASAATRLEKATDGGAHAAHQV